MTNDDLEGNVIELREDIRDIRNDIIEMKGELTGLREVSGELLKRLVALDLHAGED